jgi:hypothetical protein
LQGEFSNMKSISAYSDLNFSIAGLSANPDVLVFGDDAIFQNRFPDAGNRKLAINPGTWLTRH